MWEIRGHELPKTGSYLIRCGLLEPSHPIFTVTFQVGDRTASTDLLKVGDRWDWLWVDVSKAHDRLAVLGFILMPINVRLMDHSNDVAHLPGW